MRAEYDPDDELVAAALAAVRLYLADQPSSAARAPRPRWQVAAIAIAQGTASARGPAPVAWSSAERLARAGRWSSGLLGTFD